MGISKPCVGKDKDGNDERNADGKIKGAMIETRGGGKDANTHLHT